MKRLLLVPLLGLTLAGCTVAVTPSAPTISNVRTQGTYCTARDTKIDIKFNLGGGVISRLTQLEIVFTDDIDSNPADNGERDFIRTDNVSIGATRYRTAYYFDGDRDGAYTGVLNVRPGAIVISGTKRIWLRGFNGDTAGSYVRAGNTIEANNAPDCVDDSETTVP